MKQKVIACDCTDVSATSGTLEEGVFRLYRLKEATVRDTAMTRCPTADQYHVRLTSPPPTEMSAWYRAQYGNGWKARLRRFLASK